MIAQELSEPELDHAFAATPSTSDLWIAVNQMLRDAIIEASMNVANPANAENYGALAHAAGGLEALGRFQRDLAFRFESTHESGPKLL